MNPHYKHQIIIKLLKKHKKALTLLKTIHNIISQVNINCHVT
jgi:hypothetical protein